MANTKDSRRLDELVKQALNNYEADTATSDWARMEGLLGTAPKSVSSNFKVPSFSTEGAGLVKSIFSSYIFIIALMLAGGGYLLYTILKSPKPDTAVSVSPVDTLIDKPVQPPVTSTALPSQSTATVENKKEEIKDTVAAVKPEPAKVTEETKEAKEEKARKEKMEAELAEKKKLEEKKKSEKEKAEAEKLKASEKKKEEKREEARKAEKKEKEREKERALKAEKEKKEASKETLKKSNKPIGLSNFLRSVNLDSIKKSQEQPTPPQQPKDSVKTQ